MILQYFFFLHTFVIVIKVITKK